MNLARYEKIDINTLLSIANMKLCDEFQNIEELCRYYNIEMEMFKRKFFDAFCQSQSTELWVDN